MIYFGTRAVQVFIMHAYVLTVMHTFEARLYTREHCSSVTALHQVDVVKLYKTSDRREDNHHVNSQPAETQTLSLIANINPRTPMGHP